MAQVLCGCWAGMVVQVDDQQLAGGVANAGRVTRSGGHVLRPCGPYSGSVRAFLESLRAAGFEGVPLPAGVAEDGRERLVFIEGDVPLPPYPQWAQSGEALVSAAVLMRRFHDASSSLAPTGAAWSSELADPVGGHTICHNDACLENVVFRDGAAVALLDFDFAAPGRPVYDFAQFARMCVPVDDETSAARLGWFPADKPARLRLAADSYGLDATARRQLVEVLADSIARGGEFVRRRVEAGDPNFISMWNAMGGMERFDRRHRWWAAQRENFAAALR
jgi:Phosphotransferase enzyme family